MAGEVMLLAMTTNNETGRHTLVIGLEEENMRRLANDEPVYKVLDDIVPALAGWDISILGPEDMARFVAYYQRDKT